MKDTFGTITNGKHGAWEITEFYSKYDSLRLRLERDGERAQLPDMEEITVPVSTLGDVRLVWSGSRYISDGPVSGLQEAMSRIQGSELDLSVLASAIPSAQPDPDPDPDTGTDPDPDTKPDPDTDPDPDTGSEIEVRIGRNEADPEQFGYIKGQFGSIANAVKGEWELTQFYVTNDALRLRFDHNGKEAQLPGVGEITVPLDGLGDLTLINHGRQLVVITAKETGEDGGPALLPLEGSYEVAISWTSTRYSVERQGVGAAIAKLLDGTVSLTGLRGLMP